MKTGDILYRAEPDYRGESIDYTEHVIIRETAKCVFVIRSGFETYNWAKRTQKRITKGARKRYAYPTKKEALQSFYVRKHREVEILERRLEIARGNLSLVEREAKKQVCWPYENEEESQ